MELDDGNRLFAESLYRSRGRAAENYARNHAAELARCGDREGQEVWLEVADTIRALAGDGGNPEPKGRAAVGRMAEASPAASRLAGPGPRP